MPQHELRLSDNEARRRGPRSVFRKCIQLATCEEASAAAPNSARLGV